MKRRIGILLAGCGTYDGSDPHEAVLSMLAAQRMGHEVIPLVIEGQQFHVVDHTTGTQVEGAVREQMAEAARLVRGKLYVLKDMSPRLLDGLILPGGQGTLKNLLHAFDNEAGRKSLDAGLQAFLLEMNRAGGVIGAVSLAEFVISEVFGPWPEGKGCFDLKPEEVLVDRERRLLLTPGYTLANSLSQLYTGIENLCAEMCRLLDEANGSAQ
jgi:enhancing lycopene biosynthesis protein 2